MKFLTPPVLPKLMLRSQWLSMALVSLAIIALLLFTPEVANSQTQTYKASTDFSGVQGQGNWYYLDSSGTPLTFLNQWGGVWNLPNTSVYLGAYWGHPDSSDAVRQWRAPGAGSIQITGAAFDTASAGGDGVIVRITKGG